MDGDSSVVEVSPSTKLESLVKSETQVEKCQKRAVIPPTCVSQDTQPVIGPVGHKEDYNIEQEVALSTIVRASDGCRNCTKVPNDSGNHIMLSYNKKARNYAIVVKNKLTEKGYKVWIDCDHIMKGESVLEAMSEAVEKADAVIMFYSSDYKASTNCRAEAEYAFERRKTILPVQAEKGYSADGWLGLIIGAKYRYNLANPLKHEKDLAALLDTVDRMCSTKS